MRIGARPVCTVRRLELYPFPFDHIFDRKLHFLCLLEKC
jgi:hypothetical protein